MVFCHRPSGVAQEQLQQGEFARLEIEGVSRAGRLAREQVQLQVGDSEMGRAVGGSGRTTNERLHAGKQLGEGKGFCQVVVAPGLQTQDAVVDGGPGTEDEYGRDHFFLAELTQERETVEFGQVEVQYSGVVGDLQREVTKPDSPSPARSTANPFCFSPVDHQTRQSLASSSTTRKRA